MCAHLDHPDVVLRGGVVALVRQELREVARVEEQRVAEQRQEGVRLALGDAARRAESVSDGKFLDAVSGVQCSSGARRRGRGAPGLVDGGVVLDGAKLAPQRLDVLRRAAGRLAIRTALRFALRGI